MGIFIRIRQTANYNRFFGVGDLFKDFSNFLDAFDAVRVFANSGFYRFSRRAAFYRMIRRVRWLLFFILCRFTSQDFFRRPTICFQVVVRFFRDRFFFFFPVVITSGREDRLIVDVPC